MHKYLILFIIAPLFAATPLLNESAISQWLDKVEPGSAKTAIDDIRAYLLEKGNPDVLREGTKPLIGRALEFRWKSTRVVDQAISLLRQCPTANEECALVELGLVRSTLLAELKAYADQLERNSAGYRALVARNVMTSLNVTELQRLLIDSQAALTDATDSLANAGFDTADIDEQILTLNQTIAQLRGLLGV